MNTPYSVEEFLDANFLEWNSKHRTAKTSDEEGTRFATVPQWRASDYSGSHRSYYAISRQSHAFSCNSRIIVHVTVKLDSALSRAVT